MKKILIALLAMLLCATMLASCAGVTRNGGFGAFESGDATTGDGDSDLPDEEETQNENLDILYYTNGKLKTDYQIVVAANAKDHEKRLAQDLQDAIFAITNVKIPIMSDVRYYDDPNTMIEKEILVGDSNRDEPKGIVVPSELDVYKNGYVIFTSGMNLVFKTASKTGTYFALRDFIYKYFGQDLDQLDKDISKLSENAKSLKVLSNYTSTKIINSVHLPYVDISMAYYTIVYSYEFENENTTYMMKRMAYGIQDGVKAATGYAPDLGAEVFGTSGAVIRVHLADKEADATGSNEWIEPGLWNFEFSGKEFTITASSYFGFFAAANHFSKALNAYGFYDFGMTDESVLTTGDYRDTLDRRTESAKYCYDIDEADTRVMFLNVLFGGTAGDNGEYSVPPDERNKIQQIMIAEYMPDVLGCQEFNSSKRGEGQVIELKGAGGLAGLLAELGYAEAVDPRVKNAYLPTEIIPGADASLVQPDKNPGDPLYGYGVGGASLVNYNGVQYTYWNNAPIFYNTATTKLIAADYYWYKYQWDFIHKDEAGNLVHENGPSDAGSKAATWGVFEDIQNGQRYIVVSTHMCTRSDYIRGFQGREVVDLINKLIDQYDCPVFFGGDMNGNGNSSWTDYDTGEIHKGAANYRHFMSEEAGLISLQDSIFDRNGNLLRGVVADSKGNMTYNGEVLASEDINRLASEFTSMVICAHGYPNYDSDKRIMTPGANDISKIGYAEGNHSYSSIDQIFVKNLNDDLDIKRFGVIVDDCSMSSSDHLPYFVDFNLGGETNEGAEFGPNVSG